MIFTLFDPHWVLNFVSQAIIEEESHIFLLFLNDFSFMLTALLFFFFLIQYSALSITMTSTCNVRSQERRYFGWSFPPCASLRLHRDMFWRPTRAKHTWVCVGLGSNLDTHLDHRWSFLIIAILCCAVSWCSGEWRGGMRMFLLLTTLKQTILFLRTLKHFL